jgi:hypothetical protein
MRGRKEGELGLVVRRRWVFGFICRGGRSVTSGERKTRGESKYVRRGYPLINH